MSVDFTKNIHRRRAKVALELAYEMEFLPEQQKEIMTQSKPKSQPTDLYVLLGRPSTEHGKYFLSFFRTVGGYVTAKSGAGRPHPYAYKAVWPRIEELEKLIGWEDGLLRYAEKHGYSFKLDPGERNAAVYKRTGDRFYPWWALMRKSLRLKLFVMQHGICYDYDIQAAKATVMLQSWRRKFDELGFTEQEISDKTPDWSALIKDRTEYRQRLARDMGISVELAKAICQNVLNSAFVSTYHKNCLFQLLGEEGVQRLKTNPQYLGLRRDFVLVWEYMRKTQRQKRADTGKNERAGQCMSRLYNKIENEIMEMVHSGLSVRAWFIHDGLMTFEPIDVQAAEEAILKQSKYKITLEVEVITRQNLDVKLSLCKPLD